MLNRKIITSTTLSFMLFSSSLFAQDINSDKIYVTVNGEPITSTDIAVITKGQNIDFDNLPQENKDALLNQLVERKLLTLKATKSNIVESDEYKSTLKETIRRIKEDLALQIWINNKSNEIKVNDKELKDFYDKNKENFKEQKKFKANHILLKSEDEAKEVIDILNKSKNLKEDFIKLAKERSTGPSGKNGGDLGFFEPKMMVPEFSLATSMLKKGTITQKPVKTQFGYHVIYLDDIKEANIVPFDEAKINIEKHLSQNKFKEDIDAILKEEKKKAKIIYNK